MAEFSEVTAQTAPSPDRKGRWLGRGVATLALGATATVGGLGYSLATADPIPVTTEGATHRPFIDYDRLDREPDTPLRVDQKIALGIGVAGFALDGVGLLLMGRSEEGSPQPHHPLPTTEG